MNRQFINQMVKLHKDCDTILRSVSIAQAIEESGFGTSNLAILGNALFGIKATSSWEGKVYSTITKSVYDSYDEAMSISGGNLFRVYDSLLESVKDHNEFLKSNRYAPVREATNCNDACRLLKECGYCPEDGYDTRLLNIIGKYNLIQYDILQFPFKVKVVYDGKDGVNVRKKPNYDNSSIDKINGPIYYNSVCTVTELDGDFYKTKSGLYITSNPIYIKKNE